MEHFGVNVENIVLDPNDHDGNAQKITEAFSKGKERYKETKKQTVINFVQDMDNFLVDRNKKLDFVKETSALLYGADNCAKDGVIWMCTANNPRNIDPALLRPGRADVKLAIGNMEKFAVADMLKYSLFKYGEKNSAENFNFNKVVQEMEKNEDVFTPAELELFVREAIKKRTIPHEQITAEMVIAEIERYKQEDFITLDTETRKKFKEDQDYVKSEFSPPPPPPKKPVEIDYSKPYDAYDEEEDFK